jgi:PAS domain-containing protein
MGSSPGLSDSSNHSVRKHRSSFETRLAIFAALLAAPGLLISAIFLWLHSWSMPSKLILLGAGFVACLLIGIALHDYIVRPLQTLANVIGALREGDYSFRARLAVPNDTLGELSLEVNALADILARHRVGAIEATALLQHVVEEVDIPIFAFDPADKLRLVNPAGEKLLQRPSVPLLGLTASELVCRVHCPARMRLLCHWISPAVRVGLCDGVLFVNRAYPIPWLYCLMSAVPCARRRAALGGS